MSQIHRASVVVIGGGASGALLVAHLLAETALDIVLVEKRAEIGEGLAYSTPDPEHVLNVPAMGMSAFPDAPDHFWRWLSRSGLVDDPDPQMFPPRFTYGRYLRDLLDRSAAGGRLSVLNAAVLDARRTGRGVEIGLSDGRRVEAAAAVLAVGHEEHQTRGRGLAVRAGSPADTPFDPDAPVMIMGSGLSMVDAWLSLAGRRHRGPILVISRHGLLPRRHASGLAPCEIAAADVPFGAAPADFSRWLRRLVVRAEAGGGDWRAVVDGLRPHNQRIWQSWTPDRRRRFLAHLRPFWNIHRHRLPPDLHDRLSAAVREGRLSLLAGQFLDLAPDGDALLATIRRRGRQDVERRRVARLYDCGGVALDLAESSNPLLRSLAAAGIARPDPLRIGLDVTGQGALVGRNGAVSDRFFAIGPLTRSAFFEIESVPEIRVQALKLACLLGEDLGSGPPGGQAGVK